MKCGKCNENEAVFHYSVNINGKCGETHLCADCANEEGYGEMLGFSRPTNVFDELLASPFGSPFGGFFDDFFSPRRSMLSPFGSMLAPVMTLPRIAVTFGEQPERTETPAEASENEIPDSAGEEVSKRRELSALKHQLKEAVKAEDFEKAIELRDKIKEFDK